MTPREIDALLATHLFDWTVEHRAGERLYVTRGQVRSDYGYSHPEDVLGFSTTWHGMGLVVEAMEARGWQFRVIPQLDYGPGFPKVIYRIVMFERGVGPDGIARLDSASELPMAAALAALRALGVEVTP